MGPKPDFAGPYLDLRAFGHMMRDNLTLIWKDRKTVVDNLKNVSSKVGGDAGQPTDSFPDLSLTMFIFPVLKNGHALSFGQ